MDHVIPPGPAYSPATCSEDGIADVHIGRDYLRLVLDNDAEITIPGRTIERHGIVVHPGGDKDINRVVVTLFAANVSLTEDAEATVEDTPEAVLPYCANLSRPSGYLCTKPIGHAGRHGYAGMFWDA